MVVCDYARSDSEREFNRLRYGGKGAQVVGDLDCGSDLNGVLSDEVDIARSGDVEVSVYAAVSHVITGQVFNYDILFITTRRCLLESIRSKADPSLAKDVSLLFNSVDNVQGIDLARVNSHFKVDCLGEW